MSSVEKERIHLLNNKDENSEGKYILYMMQSSQRIYYNHALNYAIEKANDYKKPLIVAFSIIPNFPNANTRHYLFMFQGIVELIDEFKKIGVNFIVKPGYYEDITSELSKDAVMVITDRGYLRYQREIREKVSREIKVKYVEIESDVVVPIELVSSSPIPYARVYRKKVEPYLNRFIKKVELPDLINRKEIKFEGSIKTLEEMKRVIKVESLFESKKYLGGYNNAKRLLTNFIDTKLKNYNNRNIPGMDYTSNLSPYLHFGNISPVEIAYEILNSNEKDELKYLFIDELIVWRELARNFTWYEKDIYDSYKTIPSWAQTELSKHLKDRRKYIYRIEDLENAKTHDNYWNAAQKELILSGKIHNYMRMYWGKKIIEWTKDWKEAYEVIKYLNDKYALDGRDPNGYMNFAWCFGKFDRPFFETPIFGKVRYMNDKGLERKFDMNLYLKYVENL